MRGVRFLLCAVLAVLVLAVPASAQVLRVDPAERVYDYADLLTDQEEAQLIVDCHDIAQRLQIDIAILTLDSLDGMSIMNYADDFYDYNGFGMGSGGDGLVLVVCMGEREMWISTYGKAERYLEPYIDPILNEVAPRFTAGAYYGGCSRFLQASETYLQKGAQSDRFTAQDFLLALVIGFAAAGAVCGVMVLLHKRSLRPAPGAQTYLSDSGLVVTHRSDQFLHTHTTRTAIPKNNGGSGRGGGGGGGSHYSSSGRSHGGGGRKF